jgi:hypothetical protein
MGLYGGFPFGLPVTLRAIWSGFYRAPMASFGVSVGARLAGFWGRTIIVRRGNWGLVGV